jgi:hypothetical protein
MTRAARRTALAIRASVRGVRPSDMSFIWRATRIEAAMTKTRLRPSSTRQRIHFRFLFVYRETVREYPVARTFSRCFLVWHYTRFLRISDLRAKSRGFC